MLARELARKVVHVGMGAIALSLRYLTWWQAALLALVALLHNLFVFPRYGGRKIFRGEAARRGVDPGIVIYPLSVLLLVLVFRDHLEVVAGGWLLMAVGDGMAAVTGLLLGPATGRLPWNREKSWAGVLGFLAFGTPAVVYGVAFTASREVDGTLWITCAAVCAVLALLESLKTGINDNLLIPLAGGGLLYAALFIVDPSLVTESGPLLLERLPWALGVNLALGVAAYAARSVDVSGLVHGAILGSALWCFGGGAAFAMLLGFFVLGTAATKLGYRTKLAEGTAQEKGGRRGARNAWANTGAGVLFAMLLAWSDSPELFALAIVGAFATAVSDTLGSEIGQAFGRRTFLITTFRPVPRGTDGAVSLEGTLAGIAGSALLGALAASLGMIGWPGVLAVVIAAFVGTTLESYVGAVFERAKMIDNEAQNFLNTLVGGLVACAAALWLGLV